MTSEDFKLLEKALKSLDFSKFFDDSDYLRFRKVFKERGFKKGQKILWRGQKGLFFFIIGKGAVSVRVMDANREERVVASLGPGDYVGEISLLYNRPRVADCYAEEDGTLLFFLASREFYDYFVARTEVRQAMEAIAQSRMQATGKISKDAVAEQGGDKAGAERDKSASTLEELPEFSSLPAMDIDSLRETAEKAETPSVEAGTMAPRQDGEPLKAEAVTAPEPEKAEAVKEPEKERMVLPDMESDSEQEPFLPDMTGEGEPEPLRIQGAKGEDEAAGEADTAEKALQIWEGSALLSTAQRDKVRSMLREMPLDDGDSLEIPGGDEALFIIAGKGKLRCAYNEAWCRGELELGGGRSFGEMAIVFNLASSARVRSEGRSLLYAIDMKEVASLQDDVQGLKALLEARALRQAFNSSMRAFTASPSFDGRIKDLSRRFRLEFCAV